MMEVTSITEDGSCIGNPGLEAGRECSMLATVKRNWSGAIQRPLRTGWS
jgi:hypothetical protein